MTTFREAATAKVRLALKWGSPPWLKSVEYDQDPEVGWFLKVKADLDDPEPQHLFPQPLMQMGSVQVLLVPSSNQNPSDP